MVIFQVKQGVGCITILGNRQVYEMEYFFLKINLKHKMLKISGFAFKNPGFSFYCQSKFQAFLDLEE